MRGHRFLICCFVLLCSFAGGPAGAEDRPLPLVGRVSVLDGAVATRPAGGEWADSGINEPVAAGMSVRTAGHGRAELRVGAETIALAAGTELDVAQLDAAGTQLVLRRGRLGLRLSRLDPARSIEIDIPRGGVWLLTPGDYDIAAGDERAPARVAVLDGRARVVGKGLDSVIATGSANLLIPGTPAPLSLGAGGRPGTDDPVVASLDAAAEDDFVAWWRAAAGLDAEPPALRFVSAEMTGYEALDANGAWETVAGYGAMWFPQAAAEGWAPYRNGRWRWIRPWGWTWIDDMKWAFAPSHYGRWVRLDQPDLLAPAEPGSARWGWVPGRRVAQPLYAPALVAFLGTAGVGISYADAVGPAVAWFPLAPGEAYWPGYTSDPATIRRINEGALPEGAAIAAPTGGEPPADIVNGDYQNRRYASVVPRPVFTAGRPVAAALLQLPPRRLDSAPLLAGSPQIAAAPVRPGPMAATSAAASGAAGRAALAAGPRLARAVTTLARILAPRGRAVAVRAAPSARAAVARGGAAVLRGHPRGPTVRVGRAGLVAAAAHRAPSRLRFAAAHRATLR